MTATRTPTLVALAVLAALVVCVGPAQSAFPGANGKIVFASDRDGQQEIYVVTADGRSERRLTNVDHDDQYPFWSPDGSTIVFSSARDLGSLHNNDRIYVMGADGSAPMPLTDTALFHDVEPAWSRTGSRIAFRSDRENGFQIWAMNADGSNVERLTDDGENLNPTWSPTEDTISFASNRDGDYEIFLMTGDGTSQRQLTVNAAFDSNPDWSPDGRRIAFQSDRDGDFDIWIMNADGTNLRQMTDDPAFDSAPAWSPDGSELAFQSNRDGDFEIYAMSAGGADPPRQLTHNTATDRVADWQPLLPGADLIRPVLSLPGNTVVEALWPDGADVSFAVSATDNVDPNPTVTCSLASGSSFPVGTTTVSCTATDRAGNWTDGTFTVTVQLPSPNTPTGTGIGVTPVDATTGGTPVTITFNEVLIEGSTFLRSSGSGPPPPDGFDVAGVYYELVTTADFDEAEICFAHNLAPATPFVGHFENGSWTTQLPSRIPSANEVCIVVTSFSPFVLLLPGTPADDLEPPVVECTSADGLWHGANVSIGCTARDDGSGLADPDDAVLSLSTSVPDGTEEGNALTESRQVCDVAGNCATAGPIGGNKIDSKAPALTLPASRTVNATSPAGATVSYAASASDGADPSPAVSCVPTSGSVFAIGTTSVACTAIDHVGNASDGSFPVTVLGAKEQLSRLVQEAVDASKLSAAIKAQLLAKLQPLVAKFDPSDPAQRKAACSGLNTFANALRFLSGRGVPPALAAGWIADANRIRAVLAC